MIVAYLLLMTWAAEPGLHITQTHPSQAVCLRRLDEYREFARREGMTMVCIPEKDFRQ